MIRDVVTPVIDYKAAFARYPGAAVLLSPGFRILDVSDGVLELTGRRRRDLVGRAFFEAFPGNAQGIENAGRRTLRTALTQAAHSRDRVTIRLNEYDLED